MDALRFAFKVSRFRFWIYLAGTYVVGYALGMKSWLDFFSPTYVAFLLYFFFPANLLLYGVNDYWDEGTDSENPKKRGKEYFVREGERGRLLKVISAAGLLSLVLLVFQPTMVERGILLAFLFLAYFYSAEPLRFKSKPVLDFASNSLYVMPGILGFYQASGSFPVIPIVVAAIMHTSGMHLFSAIPDIEYDRNAGIKTTAVVMGRRNSLVACLAFWSILALLAVHLAGYNPFALVIFVYPLIPAAMLLRDGLDIKRIYWYWPYVNTMMGGTLFSILTITKLGI